MFYDYHSCSCPFSYGHPTSNAEGDDRYNAYVVRSPSAAAAEPFSARATAHRKRKAVGFVFHNSTRLTRARRCTRRRSSPIWLPPRSALSHLWQSNGHKSEDAATIVARTAVVTSASPAEGVGDGRPEDVHNREIGGPARFGSRLGAR